MPDDRRPVIVLAVANDRDRYLRNLPEELRRVRDLLGAVGMERLCEVVDRSNVTVAELLDLFQNPKYRDRIAILHFGGHAGDYQLLLESAAGEPALAHAGGLAEFVGRQRGLQLVFLNGCSTEPQVEGLLRAGAPAVIATSDSINDEAAMELAVRFYGALAAGATVATAYAEAAAAVKTLKGGAPRDMYRPELPVSDRWPWDLHVKDGAEVVQEWSLPRAAGDPLFGLPAIPERDLPDTPYRHLQWFREEEAEVFFGRGREIRTFYELVTAPSTAPIVLFYGQSGVGKSSLLAAGLLPRLAAGQQVRYARRQREVGLTGTLAAELGATGAVSDVAAAWRALEAGTNQPLVVILDQVEEVYTRPRPDEPDEIERFVHVLGETFADRASRPRGKLVLAFRKEWLADIEARLVEATLPRSKSYLERLDREGILEIVAGPTRSDRLRRHFRLTVDPGLPETIADDLLADREAALAPTLAVLLAKMWDKARTRNAEAPAFTVDLYLELRRAGLLLDDFLDEQLRSLRDWNAPAADAGLDLDLLTLHTTSLGTAEARTGAELSAAYAHQGATLPGLLQRSKDLYLLVEHPALGQTDGDGAPGTRLAHDTLAPLVRRRFKDSDKPGQRARRILDNRCAEWRDGKTGNCLDSDDLATVEHGAAGMPAWSGDEQRLIRASRAKRRNRRWALRAVAAAAVAAVAGIVGLYFVARDKEAEALSRALAAMAKSEPQLDLALMLGVEAVRTDATFEAVDALLATIHRPVPRLLHHARMDGGAASLAYIAGGDTLAVRGTDSTPRLWEVTGRRFRDPTFPGQGSRVNTLASSRDGATLAVGAEDGVIRIWDVRSRRLIGSPITEHRGRINSLAFSPDGKMLASASEDSTVGIWDATRAEPIGGPLAGHRGRVYAVAFSRDGAMLASGGEDLTIRLWDVASQTPTAKVLAANRQIYSLAFAPDAAILATGGAGGEIRLWNLEGSNSSENLAAHRETVYSLAFRWDGSMLASGSMDGTLRLWNPRTREAVGGPLIGSGGPVRAVAFSPDGGELASGSDDGLRLWDVGGRRSPAEAVKARGGAASDLAVSPDGRLLAFGTESGIIWLWDLKRPGAPGTVLEAHRGLVFSVAFNRDGSRLASGGNDGLRLWDLRKRPVVGEQLTNETAWALAFGADDSTLVAGGLDGLRIWNLRTNPRTGERFAAETSPVVAVALSQDGRTLASGSAGGILRLWNVARRQPLGDSIGAHFGPVYGVAFAPGDTMLATGAMDGVRLWEVKAPNGPAGGTALPLPGPVLGLAFSPDGRMLASATADGMRLVDLHRRQFIGTPLSARTSSAGGVVFSPDGATLLAGTVDGVRRWGANQAAWARNACALATQNLAADDWNRLLPGRKYHCTCAGLPPGPGATCRGARGQPAKTETGT